jgi:hypothetical protein
MRNQLNNILAPLIGVEGTRLLRDVRGQGRSHRSGCDEEASGPPAESEYLQRKSTITAGKVNNFSYSEPFMGPKTTALVHL